MALLDSWIVRYVNRGAGVSFGAIRMWGSLGWAIIALVYGFLLRGAPFNIVFYGYALFAIPCVILALCIKEGGDITGTRFPQNSDPDIENQPRQAFSLREMQLGRIVKSKPLVAYLFFNLMLYIPLMASFTFLPYILQAVGGDNSLIGVAVGIEAFMEVPLLFLSALLIRKFKITRLIIFCGLIYSVEVVLFGLCSSPWHVLLVKAMHGLGYGLYLGCMVQYIYRLAPKGLAATAQTLVTCSSAVAAIIGNFIAGAVIHAYGVSAFFLNSGIFMFAIVIVYYIWIKNKDDGGGTEGLPV